MILLAFLAACSGDDEGSDPDAVVVPPAGDDDDDDDTGTTPPDDTTPTDTSADTAVTDTAVTDTGGPAWVVDCAALSPAPTGASLMPGLEAYHGLAFDSLGNFIGSNGSNILKWPYGGGPSLYANGVSGMEQFDMAPTGLLYVASSNAIKEIDPAGGQRTVGTNIYAYGVKVGPDGMVYAADNSNIWRIDPVAGTKTIFLPSGNWSPKVLDWSVDLTKMYFGNISGGRVYSIDLDASFNPVGPPVVLAQGVGGWHDGLSVDVCGNIYVADYSTSAMYRITPAGLVSTLFDPPLTNYGHGLKFGSGIGGWREDALYIPQPYNGNTVSEIIIGVPHRTWPGKVINRP